MFTHLFACPWSFVVLALLLAAGPDATAQSTACQNFDGDEWTCDNGFTCVHPFGGGDLFERFTMRVIESTNPNAEVWILVEINGTFVTFEVGFAEQGEAFAWTVRSEAEGESYFRIDNRIANDPIRVRFNCDQADTELTEPADVGGDEIEVMDTAPFRVGDPILINPGGPNEEERIVVGFGSLLLDTPLAFAHDAGEPVISLGPAVTSVAQTPAVARFDIEARPNPARDATAVSLTIEHTQEVVVAVYDALGRQVAVLHEGPLAAGAHTLRLDAAPLPSGVYVVRASGPSGAVARRVTLVR